MANPAPLYQYVNAGQPATYQQPQQPQLQAQNAFFANMPQTNGQVWNTPMPMVGPPEINNGICRYRKEIIEGPETITWPYQRGPQDGTVIRTMNKVFEKREAIVGQECQSQKVKIVTGVDVINRTGPNGEIYQTPVPREVTYGSMVAKDGFLAPIPLGLRQGGVLGHHPYMMQQAFPRPHPHPSLLVPLQQRRGGAGMRDNFLSTSDVTLLTNPMPVGFHQTDLKIPAEYKDTVSYISYDQDRYGVQESALNAMPIVFPEEYLTVFMLSNDSPAKKGLTYLDTVSKALNAAHFLDYNYAYLSARDSMATMQAQILTAMGFLESKLILMTPEQRKDIFKVPGATSAPVHHYIKIYRDSEEVKAPSPLNGRFLHFDARGKTADGKPAVNPDDISDKWRLGEQNAFKVMAALYEVLINDLADVPTNPSPVNAPRRNWPTNPISKEEKTMLRLIRKNAEATWASLDNFHNTMAIREDGFLTIVAYMQEQHARVLNMAAIAPKESNLYAWLTDPSVRSYFTANDRGESITLKYLDRYRFEENQDLIVVLGLLRRKQLERMAQEEGWQVPQPERSLTQVAQYTPINQVTGPVQLGLGPERSFNEAAHFYSLSNSPQNGWPRMNSSMMPPFRIEEPKKKYRTESSTRRSREAREARQAQEAETDARRRSRELRAKAERDLAAAQALTKAAERHEARAEAVVAAI
jgi:hypothetical protein